MVNRVHPYGHGAVKWVSTAWLDELKTILDRDDVLLLDSRPTDVYEGHWHWPKPGHIPGALSLPWTRLLDDDNRQLLRPDGEIQAILDEEGIGPDRTIICSCGTGRKATSHFLLFKWYLGYPRVRIYEGSFTEWSAHPENPTVTGTNPRS